MKKKTSKRKSLLAAVATLFLVVVGIVSFYFWSLTPTQSQSEPIHFVVVKGDTTDTVIQRLQDQGLIRNGLTAKLMVKLEGLNEIKVGGFSIDRNWGPKAIFSRLNQMPDDDYKTVMLTFKEGQWAKDYAALIEQNTNVSAQTLLTLWSDKQYLKSLINEYDFLTEDILNENLKVGLEGYLFPNTYEFYVETTPEDITKRFLDQTKVIYQKYQSLFESSSYSVHEIFTLASITQFEAGNDADNRIVSGIWFNRLNQGMKLGSSVTVCYALYDYENWQECEQNPNIDSPYNTYRYEGIPIGPVSNPGESAIRSVLQPTQTDYLYFIAAVYTDGAIHYGKTYEQHQENIAKYLTPYE